MGGTEVYPDSFATSIYAVGNFCKINWNTVFGLRPNGSGKGISIAVYDGQECVVSNNTVIGASKKGSGRRTYVIWVQPDYRHSVSVKGNLVASVHYGMGPWGAYHDSVITEAV